MIAATVDTNVLASGFVRRTVDAPPVQILESWRRRVFTLFLSDPILAEVSRTFAKPYFASRISQEEAVANLLLLRRQAQITPITARVSGVATQPADDVVLATAVSAKVDFLVTGDGPFRRRVPVYEGILLVSPREFLDILHREGSETV